MSEHVKYVSKFVKLLDQHSCIPSITLVKGGTARLKEWTVPMRSLPLWHIYWNSTPGGRLILPEGKIEMDPDSVFLLPPYLMFATESDGAFEHFYLDFRFGDEQFLTVKKKPIVFRRKDFQWMLNRCVKQNISKLTGAALAFTLLSSIPEENFVLEGTSVMDLRIKRALDLISDTFQSGQLAGLDNRAICRKLGMSVVNFQHLFKRELKISPHRYILNRRLDYAHDLLKNSSLSIEEVAEKTGFANRYQFTRSFTRLYNISPGRWRRKFLPEIESDRYRESHASLW